MIIRLRSIIPAHLQLSLQSTKYVVERQPGDAATTDTPSF
jgi:hypothetical protein